MTDGALERAMFEDSRDAILRMAPHLNVVRAAFLKIAAARNNQDAHALALALSTEVSEVRALGYLLSTSDVQRRALEDSVLKEPDDRALLVELRAMVQAHPRLLRALAAVHPISFGPPGAEHWDVWKQWLAALPDQPVWGLPPDRSLSLRSLFVPQRFTHEPPRADASPRRPSRLRRRSEHHPPDNAEGPPIETDPRPKLLRLLRDEGATAAPIFVLAPPGLGKSSLATMLAGELALDARLQPVLIRLRDISPERPLLDEIRRVLSEDGRYGPPRSELAAVLSLAPRLVLVLDGLDELMQASRDSVGAFLLRLQELVRSGTTGPVVIFGRDTMIEAHEATVPDASHVFTLLPFDRAQASRWSASWSRAMGCEFEATRLMDEGGDEIKALATQPLMLMLLARISLEKPDFALEAENLAEVYRQIVTWCCVRHEELRGGLKASELRRFLRVLGYAALATGKELLRLPDVQRAMVNLGVTTDLNHAESLASQTILAFSMRRSETTERAWEFLHKSLGEYLAAEMLAAALTPMVERVRDEFGEEGWRMTDLELRRAWNERFAPVALNGKVPEFLATIGADEGAFLHGRPPQTDALRAFRERLFDVIEPIVREDDAEVLLAVARKWGEKPSVLGYQSISNAIVVSTQTTGRLLFSSFPPWFASSSVWDEYEFVVRRRVHFDRIVDAIVDRSFLWETRWDRALIQKVEFWDCDLAAASFMNSDLSESVWNSTRLLSVLFVGCRIQSCRLVRCGLRGALFESATLSDVTFAHCEMDRVSFRSARLENVTFRYCSLEGADFRGATGIPESIALHLDADGVYRSSPSPAPDATG